MAYVAAAAVALLVVRYTLIVRREQSARVLLELPIAAGAGLIAGLWLGVSSRAAMRAIAMANGGGAFSAGGTLQVVLVFTAIGGGVAILYPALGRNGLTFGGLLTLVTWYPLAHAAAQLLRPQPETWKLAAVSLGIIAGMWIPYALLLQIAERWLRHRTPKFPPPELLPGESDMTRRWGWTRPC